MRGGSCIVLSGHPELSLPAFAQCILPESLEGCAPTGPTLVPCRARYSRLNINIGTVESSLMNWVVVVGLILAGVVALVMALRRGSRAADLGTVSHQWIAENRRDSNEQSGR
jgi:hypothetical protein